jgi:hypothetical protein
VGDDDDNVGDDDDNVGDDDDDVGDDDDQPCDNDAFEQNDSLAAASVLTPGEYGELRLCVGSDDWYQISFEEGDEVEIFVGFHHDQGDLDMTLHRPNGTEIFASESGNDNEEMEFQVPSDGVRYLRLYLWDDPLDGLDYSIELEIGHD